MGLKRTPLYPVYAEHGGKPIDFGGWELPVQFSGIIQEHETVRSMAGLFDVSHMGEFIVKGSDAERFLQSVTTNDVGRLSAGQAQYSLMCYPDGGVVDDLLVYKLAEAEYMLVVNAANTAKDFDWLEQHLDGDVQLTDISAATALLAVQGPHATQIVAKLTDADVASLGSFEFVRDAGVRAETGAAAGEGSSGDVDAVDQLQLAFNSEAGTGLVVDSLISRTGYTGEDGFELYVPAEHAVAVWRSLLAAGEEYGLAPVGLGARDTLRFEARLPLYGQELSADISPLEAGLGFFVKLEKGEFIGREALKQQKEAGLRRKLVGIEMIDRGIPRSHYGVHDAAGEKIGEVTTGTQSPTLKKNVGLALLDAKHAAPGTDVWVDVRGKKLKAQVVKTPFYKRQARPDLG